MNNYIKLNEQDNVVVALRDLQAGEKISSITLLDSIKQGHKLAVRDIKIGENIVKYAFPIGHATADILAGQHVHTHNLKTNLGELLSYTYTPDVPHAPTQTPYTFKGYMREDGRAGTRNEVWIIPTVGCVNKVAESLAAKANSLYEGKCDGVYAFSHPYGCSQLGDDHDNTRKLLASLALHPNAGGVLILGLGCENNRIDELIPVLGDFDRDRIRFLNCQDVNDELEAGMAELEKLVSYASQYKRSELPASKLVVGLKCGGSDGFSGITANPLVGRFSDKLIAQGGTSILTEVPEMFGAETLLLNRCINEQVFDRAVEMVNGFKEYFIRHNQTIYENPSPGNKDGGISTLEDKSLGCTQKGGSSAVVDVIDYGHMISKPGLNLLSAPGNDLVASTALCAAGAQIVLFTTGRGTPFGCPAPTIKIASNSGLYNSKSNWMDFDAGRMLTEDNKAVAEDFYSYVLDVASGKQTKSELVGYREIAIFKDGVTL